MAAGGGTPLPLLVVVAMLACWQRGGCVACAKAGLRLVGRWALPANNHRHALTSPPSHHPPSNPPDLGTACLTSPSI